MVAVNRIMILILRVLKLSFKNDMTLFATDFHVPRKTPSVKFQACLITRIQLICLLCVLTISASYSQDFWYERGMPVPAGIYDILLESNSIYLAGYGHGLLISSDDGRSWEVKKLGDMEMSCLARDSIGNLYAVRMGAGVARSSDKWKTYINLGPNPLYVFHLIVAYDSVLFIDTSNGVYRSFDYGVTWSETGFLIGNKRNDMRLHYCRANRMVYTAYHGKLYSSIDSGDTWSEIVTPLRAQQDTMWITAITSNSKGELYVAMLHGDREGSVFASTDKGAQWRRLNQRFQIIEQMRCNAKDHLYVAAYYGMIYYTTDNGESFQRPLSGTWAPLAWSVNFGPDGRVYAGATGLLLISNRSTLGVSDSRDAPPNGSILFSSMFPNPARSRDDVTISFNLDRERDIGVFLYDVLGRQRTSRHHGTLPPGRHGLVFPMAGNPPGVYHVVVKAGSETAARRLLIVP
jgi:photosystem II stability/assembly factor-like uncharacterized protein